MAIKGGDLIHVGNRILIDRAQTIGPGEVTINREKIYEVGNYFSLQSIPDNPDMTFTCDSFDVSAEFEAMLLNQTFNTANGIQTAQIGTGTTGGDFTLTYGGQTTAAIPFNASPGQVQTALEALSNLAPGDVTVTGNAGGTYTITFSEAYLNGTPATTVTADATGLTPAGRTITTVAYEGVSMLDGTPLKPAGALPIDVASSFKPGFQATPATRYNVVGSVAIPNLQLESLTYQFGVTDNAQQNATLRGDTIFYNPNSTFIEFFAGTNTAGQTITPAFPAVIYRGDTTSLSTVNGAAQNSTRFALSVSLASGKRLLPGADYQESVTGAGPGYALTITLTNPVPTTDEVRVIYASTQAAQYPQRVHAPVSPVRPAAIRGRDVEIYIGGQAITNRWTSVQSVSVEWRVTLEKDEELGNAQAVSQSFDVPEVSGSVELKPRDYQELYTKICQVAGVTLGEVAGPITTVPLPLLVVLHSPDDGRVLKTIEVPDARFTLPGYSGQAGSGQKLNVTFNYESDTGDLTIWKGAKP